MTPATETVPVTILTGFLGSGKTTILSRLVRDSAMADTAVILNEFGEIGLDHLLVEASEETVIDLSCGCVCCTIRGDLIDTLTDLRIRKERGDIRPFARVVVETTGLADPAPIVHTFMQEPAVFGHYRLAGVVTVVDAVNASAALDSYPEAVKQVALADTLAITKTDMVRNGALRASLRTRLRSVNRGARQETCLAGEIDPAVFRGDAAAWAGAGQAVSRAGPNDGAADSGRHHHGITTFAVRRDEPVGRGALAMFLQMLADQKGADLLRVKGLVALTDDPSRPLVVHGVHHVVHPGRRLDAWPQDAAPTTTLVFIARAIERDWVEALLDQAATSAYATVA